MMLFTIPHAGEPRVPDAFQARCRSGVDQERCTDISPLSTHSDEIEEWVGAHYKATGHTGYTLISSHCVNISPHDAGLFPPNQPKGPQ